MSVTFGRKCPDCTGASTSFSLSASVPSNTADGCAGAAHVTPSAKVKICQPGPWHGTLSISGYDCCDSVSVVLTNADGTSQSTLASLGSASSSVAFSFDISCTYCLDDNYVQVITSDVDGCSQGWTGVATFSAGAAPP